MMFHIFKPYNGSRSTQQNLFHNFPTSIHFPMKFWIKQNHWNCSNNSKIKRDKDEQHWAASNPQPTWPHGSWLGRPESEHKVPKLECGNAPRGA
jgi:hypothetical protein